MAPSTPTTSVPARGVDGDRSGAPTGRVQGGDGPRDGAGATRPGLARTALVHPQPHRPVRQRGEHLDVHAVREERGVEPRRAGQVEGIEVGGRDAGQVRVADVDRDAGELDPVDDRRRAGPDQGGSHVDGDGAGVVDGHPAGAGAGRDGVGAGGDEARVDEVAGEHPHPVAAHLGERAVGVAVVHEPRRRAGVDPGHGRGGRVRARDAQDPVGADAPPPVAQGAHQRTAARVQVDRAVGVGEHDEVVLGAVPFDELHAPQTIGVPTCA